MKFLVAILALCASLSAQEFIGTITGIITNPNGTATLYLTDITDVSEAPLTIQVSALTLRGEDNMGMFDRTNEVNVSYDPNAVAKYSEDQPRDDHGRFTSGMSDQELESEHAQATDSAHQSTSAGERAHWQARAEEVRQEQNRRQREKERLGSSDPTRVPPESGHQVHSVRSGVTVYQTPPTRFGVLYHTGDPSRAYSTPDQAVREHFLRMPKKYSADQARHHDSGRFHPTGGGSSQVDTAFGYPIHRTGEGKFLVMSPKGGGKVHSQHDTLDDARTGALRRAIARQD